MKDIFEKLAAQENLTETEITAVAEKIFKGELSEAQIAAFLMALKIKGETPEEILGLVKTIKKNAAVIPSQTTCSFVLAAGGIHVAKHGNRSISSKSGSADVLEELGINVVLAPEKLAQVLDETGIVFLFAQKMHPAMRYISPARQALGIPTVMNLIGPLTHPMDLETQLLGLYQADLQDDLAQVLKLLGRKRAVIITGPDNMDEAALYGKNHYTLLDNGQISQGSFTFEDFDMPKVTLEDIKGGDAKENAQILVSVLKNEPSPYLETTLLNAGLGFYANGKVDSIKEGIDLAREVIASGKAYAKLKALQEAQVD